MTASLAACLALALCAGQSDALPADPELDELPDLELPPPRAEPPPEAPPFAQPSRPSEHDPSANTEPASPPQTFFQPGMQRLLAQTAMAQLADAAALLSGGLMGAGAAVAAYLATGWLAQQRGWPPQVSHVLIVTAVLLPSAAFLGVASTVCSAVHVVMPWLIVPAGRSEHTLGSQAPRAVLFTAADAVLHAAEHVFVLLLPAAALTVAAAAALVVLGPAGLWFALYIPSLVVGSLSQHALVLFVLMSALPLGALGFASLHAWLSLGLQPAAPLGAHVLWDVVERIFLPGPKGPRP